jgi:hypothetical protein
MADDTSTETTTEKVAESTTQASAAASEDDWQDKFKGQQKVNRDLERKYTEAQKRLQEIEDRDKTEAQKLAERAEAAERSATEAQRELLRLRVISEVGLPVDLHEFVVGNDEDELRAKATKLKAQFGADQRSVDVGLGPRQTAQVSDMNSLIRQQAAARRGG